MRTAHGEPVRPSRAGCCTRHPPRAGAPDAQARSKARMSGRSRRPSLLPARPGPGRPLRVKPSYLARGVRRPPGTRRAGRKAPPPDCAWPRRGMRGAHRLRRRGDGRRSVRACERVSPPSRRWSAARASCPGSKPPESEARPFRTRTRCPARSTATARCASYLLRTGTRFLCSYPSPRISGSAQRCQDRHAGLDVPRVDAHHAVHPLGSARVRQVQRRTRPASHPGRVSDAGPAASC